MSYFKEHKIGFITTFIVHVLVIVLLCIYGFFTPLPLPEERGILVDFGNTETGSGRKEPAKPKASEPVQETKPTPSVSQPAPQPVAQPEPTPESVPAEPSVGEDLMTQDFEKTVAMNTAKQEAEALEKKRKEQEELDRIKKERAEYDKKQREEKARLDAIDAEKKRIEAEEAAEQKRLKDEALEKKRLEEERIRKVEEEAERKRKAEEEAERKRKAAEEAERKRLEEEARIKREKQDQIDHMIGGAFGGSGSSSTSNAQSQGEGASSTGNQGSASGTANANTYGDGLGSEGISFGLEGRNPVTISKPEFPGNNEGIVVVNITVDKYGNVTNATGGAKGSTSMEVSLIRAAEQAAKATKFNTDSSAPAQQRGTITYHFLLD